MNRRLLIIVVVVAYATTRQFHGIGLGAVLSSIAGLGLAGLGAAGLGTAVGSLESRPAPTIVVARWAVLLRPAHGDAR